MLTAIIVDDELASRETLQNYLTIQDQLLTYIKNKLICCIALEMVYYQIEINLS